MTDNTMTEFDLAAVRLFLAAVARVREGSGGTVRGVAPVADPRRTPAMRDVSLIARDIAPMCSPDTADAIRTHGWARWVDRREAEWLAALAREGGLPVVRDWLLRLSCARMRLWAPMGHSQSLRLAWPDGRDVTIRRSRTGDVTAESDGLPVGVVDSLCYPAEEPHPVPPPDAIVPVQDYPDPVITEAVDPAATTEPTRRPRARTRRPKPPAPSGG